MNLHLRAIIKLICRCVFDMEDKRCISAKLGVLTALRVYHVKFYYGWCWRITVEEHLTFDIGDLISNLNTLLESIDV
jgi:hypothetical protein